jgi:hypothetical protein
MSNVLQIQCACGCGTLIEPFNEWGYKRKFKHGHNSSLRKREKHPFWTGGSFKIDRGYIRQYVGDGKWMLLHRKVWQETHKASLLPWADVHHIDHNRQNNSPENLKAMMNSTHRRQEKLIDMSNYYCSICGSKTTYIMPKSNRPQWFNAENGKHVCKICHMRQYNSTKRKRLEKNLPQV